MALQPTTYGLGGEVSGPLRLSFPIGAKAMAPSCAFLHVSETSLPHGSILLFVDGEISPCIKVEPSEWFNGLAHMTSPRAPQSSPATPLSCSTPVSSR